MINRDLIIKAYKISDKYNVILKDFVNVTRAILIVNRVANKNLKEIKKLIKSFGYNKIWSKGVFSFYGDLRPLAVEAGFGKWSKNGLITNEKYGTNFLITAIFYK